MERLSDLLAKGPCRKSPDSHVCSVIQSCLTLCDPTDCSLPGSSVHGIFLGKNTGVGCHFLLQEIFLTQGLNLRLLRLLHWQVVSLLLRHLGSLLLIPKPLLSPPRVFLMMSEKTSEVSFQAPPAFLAPSPSFLLLIF